MLCADDGAIDGLVVLFGDRASRGAVSDIITEFERSPIFWRCYPYDAAAYDDDAAALIYHVSQKYKQFSYQNTRQSCLSEITQSLNCFTCYDNQHRKHSCTT